MLPLVLGERDIASEQLKASFRRTDVRFHAKASLQAERMIKGSLPPVLLGYSYSVRIVGRLGFPTATAYLLQQEDLDSKVRREFARVSRQGTSQRRQLGASAE